MAVAAPVNTGVFICFSPVCEFQLKKEAAHDYLKRIRNKAWAAEYSDVIALRISATAEQMLSELPA